MPTLPTPAIDEQGLSITSILESLNELKESIVELRTEVTELRENNKELLENNNQLKATMQMTMEAVIEVRDISAISILKN
jgi:regulator of replication initiation timing